MVPMTSPRGRRSPTARPGDGSALRPYRLKQAFTRTLFFVDLEEPWAGVHTYAVDVDYEADELPGSDSHDEETALDGTSASPVALYRDGIQIGRSDLPAVFPVPGGQIEVTTVMYGLRRMHYLRDDDGDERVLRPHPLTPEGLRAAFARRAPRASRAVGKIAVVVLLAGLALTIPQGLETLTARDVIAQNFGSFVSPIHLPAWANTALLVATTLAAIERALTLRRHWLIDLDSAWGGEE